MAAVIAPRLPPPHPSYSPAKKRTAAAPPSSDLAITEGLSVTTLERTNSLRRRLYGPGDAPAAPSTPASLPPVDVDINTKSDLLTSFLQTIPGRRVDFFNALNDDQIAEITVQMGKDLIFLGAILHYLVACNPKEASEKVEKCMFPMEEEQATRFVKLMTPEQLLALIPFFSIKHLKLTSAALEDPECMPVLLAKLSTKKIHHFANSLNPRLLYKLRTSLSESAKKEIQDELDQIYGTEETAKARADGAEPFKKDQLSLAHLCMAIESPYAAQILKDMPSFPPELINGIIALSDADFFKECIKILNRIPSLLFAILPGLSRWQLKLLYKEQSDDERTRCILFGPSHYLENLIAEIPPALLLLVWDRLSLERKVAIAQLLSLEQKNHLLNQLLLAPIGEETVEGYLEKWQDQFHIDIKKMDVNLLIIAMTNIRIRRVIIAFIRHLDSHKMRMIVPLFEQFELMKIFALREDVIAHLTTVQKEESRESVFSDINEMLKNATHYQSELEEMDKTATSFSEPVTAFINNPEADIGIGEQLVVKIHSFFFRELHDLIEKIKELYNNSVIRERLIDSIQGVSRTPFRNLQTIVKQAEGLLHTCERIKRQLNPIDETNGILGRLNCEMRTRKLVISP